MEMPITSCPSSRRRAAVTEESTPPLMATTTRFLSVCLMVSLFVSFVIRSEDASRPGSTLEAGENSGEHRHEAIDVRLGVPAAKGKAERSPGQFRRDPHGSKDRGAFQ